jgi:hypothetical protein
MVMKKLIRKILKEDANLKVLKKYITRDLQKQVNSGEVPILDFVDLARKKLSENYYDEIRNIYFDFVGGEEEAFKLFKKYLEDKSITDEDIRKIGRMVFPSDHYKIIIKRIYNLDYKGNRIIGSNEELEFGFSLLDGQFDTSEGIMTLEELYDEKYDDIWLDVEDVLRSEIEDYVESIANNFGLEFDIITSHWDN